MHTICFGIIPITSLKEKQELYYGVYNDEQQSYE